MTDSQCVAFMAALMRSTLVLCDVLTEKGPLKGPKVQPMDNQDAVDLAADIFEKARERMGA